MIGRSGVVIVTDDHGEIAGQLGEDGFVHRSGPADDVMGVRAELLVIPIRAGDTDDRDSEPPGNGQFVDIRYQLLPDQIPGRAEKDEGVCAGFDDIVLALVSDPPLTTIRQPLADLAQFAIREALAEKSDEATPGRSILLRPELVIRGSTGEALRPGSPAAVPLQK